VRFQGHRDGVRPAVWWVNFTNTETLSLMTREGEGEMYGSGNNREPHIRRSPHCVFNRTYEKTSHIHTVVTHPASTTGSGEYLRPYQNVLIRVLRCVMRVVEKRIVFSYQFQTYLNTKFATKHVT